MRLWILQSWQKKEELVWSAIASCLQLAFTCIELDPEIRPMMVDVTKELRRIERSIA
jgi:hypothetical protein